MYEYARFNGTAIVQNTKNSDVKKEGHSSVKRTGKRTLMREREENTVLRHGKKTT